MAYSLVLFDCDGTLVHSEPMYMKAILDVLKKYGMTGYDMDRCLNEFSGKRFSNIMEIASEDSGVEVPFDDARDLYFERVDSLRHSDLEIVDCARDVVVSAKQHAKICVVSNGERQNVLSAMDATDLRQYFEDRYIFTGAMADNPKPAPDLYLMAAEARNVSPAKTLVIEDSPTGVIAGKAAGMTVWGFTGTHHDPATHTKTLRDAGANEVFKSMTDLNHRLVETLNP